MAATLSATDAIQKPQGLSSEAVRRLLKQYGPNEPAPACQYSLILGLLRLFVNPLAIILLIAAGFSMILGQIVDATMIIVMVVLGIALNFVQTYRSQRAIEALRQRVSTTASVLRDGSWQEVPRAEIVLGDLVRLAAGDLVPADALLIEAKDLYVQQATLTGESLPVEKESSLGQETTEDPSTPYMIFFGTSVVSGSALAAVTATGPRTVFGGIATKLAHRPPETEFERGIRQFGLLIMNVVLFLVLFLITVSIVLHHDPFQSLLFAVALAVGLTPEFLPMITSVTLAKGAVQMARQKVIVKHLPAIQNLGSIDVLCSDKTGTLTGGVMKLERALDAFGAESGHALLLGYLNSRFETGIRNPLNRAILDCLCPGAEEYTKRDEIPFDFERRCMSVIVERNGQRLLITKGAPESVVARCSTYESAEGCRTLSDSIRNSALSTFQKLSVHGYRVLAVGSRPVEKQDHYAAEDEVQLTLAGYLAFADPPRSDTAETIAALRRDGVQLKILTGDNELVSRHICEQVGLDVSEIVLGEEIARMTDTALGHIVEETTIFARVSPAQKNRIILALKHRSHVVGYLGDGINDAPSLHTADVGISVDGAADVAREGADIILVEPGLGVLHGGILEGRKASANVLKYLLMGTSSNFGNMLSMAGASIFLPFLPMLPTQILLNNFLYDVAQVTIPTDAVDAAYLQTPQRWKMSLIRNFMMAIGPISSLFDFLTFFFLLRYFHARQAEFHTGWFVESLATQTLVLFVIRTFGNPLKSRPSTPLTCTVFGVVAIGVLLPFTPIASTLGFTTLPIPFFMFLAIVTGIYLLLVDWAKQRIFPPLRQKPGV
ncbi:MAG: magnesium-translocating P-type ATPase [Acidobacteriaceae bacterium]|nr:magnesium-translocating P-type ATPase [Acidobacteriaceae bacterium]